MTSGKVQMGAPNFMKMLIDELKIYETEYTAFVSNGRRYQS
jgi:hypothetical protein